MRVLTWNLFHGRSRPSAGRALQEQFARLLAAWSWDVALLQEVPPWWPAQLATLAAAEQRTALTSRNAGLVVRRALAERWPDLVKSNGGGCNTILSRSAILEHRTLRLSTRPERRVAQLVRLADGTVLVNFHASTQPERAARELERLWAYASAWAAGAPFVLGGDLNLRSPSAPCDSVRHVAQRDVDHLFASGLYPSAEPQVLDRRVPLGERMVELSDHPPLLASLCSQAPAPAHPSERQITASPS
jgi:endonuclease/exonuclease/phosphatase family metal-dependent hydrolase